MNKTGDILKKIRHIELNTRKLVDAAFAGRYHSVFKGRGMNFDEVREYAPGDEIRSIDWNVTARTGIPHIKKFREERELSVMLVVDVSASGSYGSQSLSKRELAAEVASLLAFSAIRNSDKVGLLLFSDDVEHYVPPKKARQHVLRLIRDILYFDPQGVGTNPGLALTYLNRVLTRRAVVFLISDFLTPPFPRELAVTARRHDLVALPIADPCEEELPPVGIINFQDAETGEQIEIDTSSTAVRQAYAGLAARRSRELYAIFKRLRIDSVPLVTNQDYMPALKSFFRQRLRRIRMS